MENSNFESNSNIKFAVDDKEFEKQYINELEELTLQDKENITFIIKKKKNKSCPKGISRYM